MSAERVKLSVEEYLGELLELVAGARLGAETVGLDRASGRVLAESVTSRGAVPAFANSAMDGFAVRHSGLAAGDVLAVAADVPAGSGADPRFGAGACVRIMTGAPVPTDADTVVPLELTTEVSGGVRIDEVPATGAHVRAAGEDLAAGDEVLRAGAALDARALSLVAACGRAEVAAVRRPVVAVAATGDELVAPGGDLARGQIYESNATFLAHAARRDGAEVRPAAGPLPDDADAFARELADLAEGADVVVLSGGVSVGDYDVVRIVLGAGDAAFRHVRMQPGKPQGWARWPTASGGTVPVVCLPGNPLSAATSYEVFVRPLLDALLGRVPPGWEPAVAGTGWRSPAGRRQFVPVSLEVDASGRRVVRPAHRRASASHMVSSLALADAIAMVAEDADEVAPGDIVQIRSLT